MFDHRTCPPGAHDHDPRTTTEGMHELEWPPLCVACSAPLTYCTTINDNAHVGPTGPACLAIDAAAVDLVLRIQREITRDVAAGLVPIWVSSLWHLQDYVDANTYGGLAETRDRVPTATVIRVHAEVDRWLAAQGHVPTFSVRTPDYEITRVHAASLPDAQWIIQRHPHVRVVVDVHGGTVTVKPTDLPGPGLRRARIRTGPHAGHLATFSADRDLAGLTSWIHDSGAYFDGEVEEVCGAWLPFAWHADRSPVVCRHPADQQHAEHAAQADDGGSALTWTSVTPHF